MSYKVSYEFSMIAKITSPLLVLILTAGCATMKNGGKQTVTVVTTPINGAACTLSNKKGTWAVKRTPSTVVIRRSSKPLTIECHEPGWRSDKVVVKSKVPKNFAGGAIIGGITGTAIDLMGGAAYEYPERIVIKLHR